MLYKTIEKSCCNKTDFFSQFLKREKKQRKCSKVIFLPNLLFTNQGNRTSIMIFSFTYVDLHCPTTSRPPKCKHSGG